MRQLMKCMIPVILFSLFIQAFSLTARAEGEKETSQVMETEENIRRPVRQDALTMEQEKEGWYLIGGYAYPPEALEGDAGISSAGMSSFSGENKLSNVTFIFDLPDGQTEPFILYFTNADTFQEYYIESYASNNYTVMTKMPAGSYYFTGGGPANDYMSLYRVVTPKSFTVCSDTDLLVNPVILSRGEALKNREEETAAVTESQIAEETETTEEIIDMPGLQWQTYLILAAILIIAGLLIGTAFLLISKHNG